MDNYIGDVRVVETASSSDNYIGDVVVVATPQAATDFIGTINVLALKGPNYIGDVRIVASKDLASNYIGEVVAEGTLSGPVYSEFDSYITFDGRKAFLKFDKTVDPMTIFMEDFTFLQDGDPLEVDSIGVYSEDPTFIQVDLLSTIQFQIVTTFSYGGTRLKSLDGGVAEIILNAAIPNGSTQMPGEADFISHLKRTVQDGWTVQTDGYYWPDAVGTNKAKLVSSYGLNFGADNSSITGTYDMCYYDWNNGGTRVGYATKWTLWGKLKDITTATERLIIKTGYVNSAATPRGCGVEWCTNANKFVMKIANGWGNYEVFTFSTVLDLAEHKYAMLVDYESATRTIKFYIDDVLKETKTMSAGMAGNYICGSGSGVRTASTAVIGSAAGGNTTISSRFDFYRLQVEANNTILADVSASTNAVVARGMVTGASLPAYYATVIDTNDLMPVNLLMGFQLYQHNTTKLYRYIPYKRDGSVIYSTHNGTEVTNHTWVGDYPAGNGHNFCETKVKLNSDTIVSIHDLCNISTEKYFIKPDAEKIVSEVVTYTAIRSAAQIEAILGYFEIADYTGTYGMKYDPTLTDDSPAVVRTGTNMSLHYTLPIHRKMKGCLVADDGTVNYYLDAHDWSKRSDGTASDCSGADGNVMIEIPELYVKYGNDGTFNTADISLFDFEGATKKDKFYISAYNSALDRANMKLASVKNTTANYRGGDHGNPATESWRIDRSGWDGEDQSMLGMAVTKYRRSEFRNMARAKGTGWEIECYEQRKLLVWLMVIEYGNRNMQRNVSTRFNGLGHNLGGLGNGAVDFGVNATSITPYYGAILPFVPNGTSDSLGNFSGEVIMYVSGYNGDVDNDIHVNRWRGIELPFWGDLLYMVDGVNIYDSNEFQTKTAYLYDNHLKFEDKAGEQAGRICTPLPLPASGDFSPIKNVFFGTDGDIVASEVYGLGGQKEFDSAFADRYHSGLAYPNIPADKWWLFWFGNDIVACGDLGKSGGPFFQWCVDPDARGDNTGCKLMFFPSF